MCSVSLNVGRSPTDLTFHPDCVLVHGRLDNKVLLSFTAPVAKCIHIYPELLSHDLDEQRGSRKSHEVMDAPITLDVQRPRCRFFHFPNSHLVCHPSSLPSGLSPLLQPLGGLKFHSHPQLLVPEQQFASGLVELQPVNLGVVADGSQIVAPGQVH